MDKIPSKAKLKNFRRKIKNILDEELSLREQIKSLYSQFEVDVGDNRLAKRAIAQMYFDIEKFRYAKRQSERLEFHPFFTSNPYEVQDLDDGLDGEDDDII